MASADHFIEAHYYDSGLRHQAFGVSRRPSWAPPEDAVGFQDEFPLDDGDGAVELRRFELGSDRITWLGVYYRSVDAKLGDRQNHAGVGVWLRNGVVLDVAALLYGLSNLASFLARNIDIDALRTHVEKFSEAAYLPTYFRSLKGYEFAEGAPYGPAAMVDTQRYFVSCAGGIGECRALSDYLLTLMLYASDEALRPRSLILVSAKEQPSSAVGRMVHVPSHFDAGATITSHLPALFASVTKRAKAAEAETAELKGQLAALESEAQSLRTNQGEKISVRDDPLNIILRRLDDMSTRPDQGASPQRPFAHTYNPIVQKRNPVTTTTSTPPEQEYEIDWLTLIIFVIVGVLVIFIIIFALNRLAHFF